MSNIDFKTHIEHNGNISFIWEDNMEIKNKMKENMEKVIIGK